jgi:Mlc titration factor MtfA (ptsG expression regulator)
VTIASLLQRWRRAREERVLKQRAIPDKLWQRTLVRHPYLRRAKAEDAAALRRMATLFLDRKEFSGAQGLVVTDAMAVAVAAQACLPVLHLGLHLYDGFVGIVMHRDEVVAARHVTDEDGVVHEYQEVLAGEAMRGGPMMLSWRDVASARQTADSGYNVVIHEFVHIIDMIDGVADGMPPMPDRATQLRWRALMDEEYEAFCRRVDAGEATALDPYGAEGVDEFFPVAAEAFFVSPQRLRDEHPRLYDAFVAYFKQDPAGERVPAGDRTFKP